MTQTFSAAPLSMPSRDGWDFELPDHRGGSFRLAAQRDAGAAAVIVFFRGHWCPYCRRYLAKLQSNIARFAARDAALAAISPEPPATARGLAQQLELTFPLLSDADGRVIDRYGVRNGFRAGRSLLPHASVFIFDAAGELRFKSIDRNFKKRTTVRTIFRVLDEIAEGRGKRIENGGWRMEGGGQTEEGVGPADVGNAK